MNKKYFYYVFVWKNSEDKLHAEAVRLSTDDNLLLTILKGVTNGLITAHPCDTSTFAQKLAAFSNECYVQNGTYDNTFKGVENI